MKPPLALLALAALTFPLIGCGDSGDASEPPPAPEAVTAGVKKANASTSPTVARPQPIGAGQGVGFGPDEGHAKGDRYMPPSAHGAPSGKLDTELPK